MKQRRMALILLIALVLGSLTACYHGEGGGGGYSSPLTIVTTHASKA